MCTRYTLQLAEAALAAIAKALSRKLVLPAGVKPKYNIAVSQVVPAVAEGAEGPEVTHMMWGLVPFYERVKARKRMLPNAKSETAASGTAFRESVATRRCLVPADGFYEWQAAGKVKYPHLFTLKNEEPFAFAGIWEPGVDDTLPPSFAILTTEPNGLVAPIHNRMPVILTHETMARWIGREPLPEPAYHELTRPLAAENMRVRPVNRFVSNSRNEGPRCIAPPDPDFAEPDLFG